MRVLTRIAGACLSAVVLGACAEDGSCTLEPRPGLLVEVRDSVTGAPAAAGSIIIATDGAYTDSVNVTNALQATLAGNRGGTYALQIRKAGYMTWQRSNIVVAGGRCGPDAPVEIIARLRPS